MPIDDHQSTHPSNEHLMGEVERQSTVQGLRRVCARIPRLQQSLVNSDVSAVTTGHVFTAFTDPVTIRLLQLAEAQLGSAPVDFVWVAAGSQARNEQTARTDQDNCLVLDDRYEEARRRCTRGSNGLHCGSASPIRPP